jgi:hypothetical protein
MLGIHPGTLSYWLKDAQQSTARHPTDNRITCVEEDSLLRVAQMHQRVFLPPSQLQAAASGSLADLTQQLSCLETKVAALQEQMAQLALALLMQHPDQQTTGELKSLLTELVEVELRKQIATTSRATEEDQRTGTGVPKARTLNPAEQRARTRTRPPLVVATSPGTDLTLTTQEGELHLKADSQEWFDWLTTIASFRFECRQGAFTAYRGYDHGPTRSWSAYRNIRGHHTKRYLGVTEALTIATLERIAAWMQAQEDSA